MKNAIDERITKEAIKEAEKDGDTTAVEVLKAEQESNEH